MGQGDIPDHARRFISQYIDSVGELEALLLLRALPGEAWELGKIASRLYVRETETARILARLCRNGLLVRADTVYKFECQTEELRRVVDELAELYARQLIPITNLIHAKSPRIREFADAFRLRKDQ